jgi:hypothetical protein
MNTPTPASAPTTDDYLDSLYEDAMATKAAAAPMTVTGITREPITHELKTWQSYFHAINDGSKLFEIRRDDRDYRVDDFLLLRETEYGSGNYTGRECTRRITYILRREDDLGLKDGFAILSLEDSQVSHLKSELERVRSSLEGTYSLAIAWAATYSHNAGQFSNVHLEILDKAAIALGNQILPSRALSPSDPSVGEKK